MNANTSMITAAQLISKAIILLFYTFVNIIIYFYIHLSIQLSTDEATIHSFSAT